MTRQRLTRAEKSAQTRAQLMASARQLFLRRGFHAASLELVAEEAGFTIGAVYSRFGSKADLFLAILDEHIDRIVAEVAKVADLDQPREFGARHERLVAAYAGLIEADYARLGLPLPMAPEVLARAVVAMGNGVALERLADPGRVPEGLLSTMAVAFLRGAAADGPATEGRS
jgi:AcrR family transcriptional regulator